MRRIAESGAEPRMCGAGRYPRGRRRPEATQADLLLLKLMLSADVFDSSEPLAGDDMSVLGCLVSCVPPSEAWRGGRRALGKAES